MALAQLSISLPEGTWIRAVSTDHPDAVFRVLTAMPAEDTGVALLQITSEEMETILTSIAGHQEIVDIEPIEHGDGRTVVRIETKAPLLLLSAQASGVPIEPPIVIQNGVANVEVRAPHDRLSMLGDQLERFGLTFTVDAIHDESDPKEFLSERQRELLLEAVDRGYYDTPRECSLTELAEGVGLAKSTTSEILHRAEETIIRRFVDRHLRPT